MYLTIIFLIVLIVPFIVIPRHMKIGILSPYRTVIFSTITVASLAALIFMIASLSGEGLYLQLYNMVKLMAEQLAAEPMMIETFKLGDATETERMNLFIQIYDAGLKRLPVMIMFFAAVVSYIAYIVTSKIVGRKHDVKKMPKFREFTFPQGTGIATMIMYIIGWIMLGAGSAVGEMMYANINVLFDLIFSLQGTAVVFMFFHFKKVPQAVSVIVSGIMWATSIGKTFLILLGIADLFLGIRGWMAAKGRR